MDATDLEPELNPPTSYDLVPYPRWSGMPAHPNRMASMATLYGMEPPDVNRCRVLELACAAGGNLIPIAYGLPNSTFLGLDLSSRQVEAGQQAIRAIGLENIRLEHRNILDVGREIGEFDYIIAHGVYSWVPRDVQEKIFAVCARHLAPSGVAYISYNTYPGWHSLRMMREIMLYHTEEFTTPKERIDQARAVMRFVTNAAVRKDRGHAQILREHLSLLGDCSDSYLYHELLEENNCPEYFHQFAARAKTHGLQFLSESVHENMLAMGISADVDASLESHGDRVVYQQYTDFLLNRTFRKTLLCRAGVPLLARPDASRVARFRIVSFAVPESPHPDVISGAVEQFKSSSGAITATPHPVEKAALVELARAAPRSLMFDELLAAVRQRLDFPQAPADEHEPRDEERLKEILLILYGSGIVEFELYQSRLVLEVSERPMVSPVARQQTAEECTVTNVRHQTINILNPVAQQLLPLLDGRRTRAELLEHLLECVSSGALQVDHNGAPATDLEMVRRVLDRELGVSLSTFAWNALLVG